VSQAPERFAMTVSNHLSCVCAVRQQYILSKPLYAKRAELVAKIPKFWALVLEQAPVEIDEYIQPTDANVLYSHLTNLTVSRFSLEEDEKKGDPRNFLVRFEFSENEYFEDRVIEKKFWWRHSKDGFEGLVSEPVTIKWKEGKDLTEGLLDLAKAVYDEQLAAPKEAKKGKQTELTEKQKTLKKKISETGMGGVSFFCFFGYVGEIVSEEESKEVIAKENERRKKRQAGEKVKDEDEDMEDEEDLDDDEEDDELDIFPPGDVVAVTIADELWPNAIKYFSEFLSRAGA